MAGAESDVLRESIAVVAGAIDVEAVRGMPDSDDPMLRLLQQEILGGAEPDVALTSVIDRVAAVGAQVLSILDFPPNATMGYKLGKKLEEDGANETEIDAAVSYLGNKGKIDQINGWYFKKPEPIVVDRDDIDWLFGTGRFAQ